MQSSIFYNFFTWTYIIKKNHINKEHLYKNIVFLQPQNRSVAQLVQSASVTLKRSSVRARSFLLPHKADIQKRMFAFFFVYFHHHILAKHAANTCNWMIIWNLFLILSTQVNAWLWYVFYFVTFLFELIGERYVGKMCNFAG